jgi:hypothetical protein
LCRVTGTVATGRSAKIGQHAGEIIGKNESRSRFRVPGNLVGCPTQAPSSKRWQAIGGGLAAAAAGILGFALILTRLGQDGIRPTRGASAGRSGSRVISVADASGSAAALCFLNCLEQWLQELTQFGGERGGDRGELAGCELAEAGDEFGYRGGIAACAPRPETRPKPGLSLRLKRRPWRCCCVHPSPS